MNETAAPIAEISVVDLVIERIESMLPDLAGSVRAASSFSDDLDMDSLHLTELVAQLEDSLSRDLPEEVESARTPADLAEAVQSHLDSA